MEYYYNPETSAKPSRIRKIWAAGSYYPGDMGEPIDLSIGIPYIGPELEAEIEKILISNRKKFTTPRAPYASAEGNEWFRETVADFYSKRIGYSVKPNMVIPGVGSLSIVVCTVLATSSYGKEVLYPSPGFGEYYIRPIRVFGAKPVPYYADKESLKNDPESIISKITDKTSLIILNSPCNPTGVEQPVKTIEALLEVAAEKKIHVLNDGVYSGYETRYTDQKEESFSLFNLPNNEASFIETFSGSKARLSPGRRAGFAICSNPELRARIIGVQFMIVASVPHSSQEAVCTLFTEPRMDEICRKYKEKLIKTKKYVTEAFTSIPGVKVVEPEGAIYAFPNVAGTGLSATEFVKVGIRAGVRMVEGWAFIPEPSKDPNHTDGNHYVRLCFAALPEPDHAKEAAERIKTVLETPKMKEEALKIEV
ncbi:MAG: pyridoxal phosphate-dependent aminotransferase [Candidatus Hodarchaeota archaeon]